MAKFKVGQLVLYKHGEEDANNWHHGFSKPIKTLPDGRELYRVSAVPEAGDRHYWLVNKKDEFCVDEYQLSEYEPPLRSRKDLEALYD